jgi:hypothetical protein
MLKMSNNQKLFVFLIGFYTLLLNSFNVKTYLLIFILAFCVYFFYFKYPLIKSVFLILITSLPFENNIREWIFTVTQPLYASVATSGYFYYFGVSLKLIFGTFLFLLLLSKKNRLKQSFKNDWPLIIFFIIACLNTLYFFSIITITGLIRLWLSVFIYFAAKIFFKYVPKIFPIVISAIFIFSVFIGLNQLIRQKPLGKFIELTPSFSQEYGYSTTDGKSQYRVAGFISHPVYFGSFMSILLPIFIAFSLSTNLLLAFPISLIGITVMLGTNSRSVWINLALTLVLIFPHLKQKYKKLATPFNTKFLIPAFILISSVIIISRIGSITQLFSKNGNGSIRLELMWQSLIMISQHPLGVGLNQFTSRLIDLPIPKSLNGFIVPVHNTILLISSELGIIAGSLFIFFIIKSILINKKYYNKNIVVFGAIIGSITFLVSSQFHPLLNLDPTFDLFMLTLGYINSQCQS